LRKCLSPLISHSLRQSISALQEKFTSHLHRGESLRNVGKKLSKLAVLIGQNEWLRTQLDDDVQQFMSNYPSWKKMETLFELREEIASDGATAKSDLNVLIDEYCISFSRGTVNPD